MSIEELRINHLKNDSQLSSYMQGSEVGRKAVFSQTPIAVLSPPYE